MQKKRVIAFIPPRRLEEKKKVSASLWGFSNIGSTSTKLTKQLGGGHPCLQIFRWKLEQPAIS